MTSEKMSSYLGSLQKGVEAAYEICQRARSMGFDPDDKVEILHAKDMAERVEGLISVVEPKIKGSEISERI